MLKGRPWGVTVIGVFLAFTGAIATFNIFVEAIDSIRSLGLRSILIVSIPSLLGFIFYAGIPLLFYFTGAGLFTGSSWARQSVLVAIPLSCLFFTFNFACSVAREESLLIYSPTPELIASNLPIFADAFIRYLLLIGPLVYYFRRAEVRNFFNQANTN